MLDSICEAVLRPFTLEIPELVLSYADLMNRRTAQLLRLRSS